MTDHLGELIELMAEANWRSQVGPEPGWPDDHTMPDVARSRARAALDALKAAGYEVVKLPEPDAEDPREWTIYGTPDGLQYASVYKLRDGAYVNADEDMGPHELRDLAAALLAAAKAVEAVGDE